MCSPKLISHFTFKMGEDTSLFFSPSSLCCIQVTRHTDHMIDPLKKWDLASRTLLNSWRSTKFWPCTYFIVDKTQKGTAVKLKKLNVQIS